jgi:hypothetical protein
MLLRHTTLARNLTSILRSGLLCSKSQGKKPVVWACAPGKTAWACLHVIRRHGGKAQEVVVLEIDVPRSWLRRHGGAARALWYSVRDVGPHQIRRVITFGELSRSPVEEEPATRPRVALAG